jgi:DnaJ family protein B protein 4
MSGGGGMGSGGGIRFGPSMGGSMGGMGGSRAQAQPQQVQKGKDVNHTLFVTLREVYNGCTKKMRITKRIMDVSGRSTQVAVDKEISILPGWKDGTKITFEREGGKR